MNVITNITALQAIRNMNSVNIQRTAERLSSGLRINRSADDAAGLAISEKMRNQIRGLDQATRNVQDGISLLQVMDGGLSKIHEILARQRELVVQGLNGVYTMMDRLNIQIEIDQLSEEITALAYNTEFNGIKPLASRMRVERETVTQSLFLDPFISASAFLEEQLFTGTIAMANTLSVGANTKVDLFYFDFFGGSQQYFTMPSMSFGFYIIGGETLADTDYVLTSPTGQEFRWNLATSHAQFSIPGFAFMDNGYGAFNWYLWGWHNDENPENNGRWILSLDNSRNANAVTNETILGAGGRWMANENRYIYIGAIEQRKTEITRVLGSTHMQIQSGANANQRTSINLFDVSAQNLNIHNLNILSLQQANDALLQLDKAINTISTYRAKSGSQQNRLGHALNNLQIAHENTSASNARIRDADMAKEMIELNKSNIKKQTAILMLAQANISFERILSLI